MRATETTVDYLQGMTEKYSDGFFLGRLGFCEKLCRDWWFVALPWATLSSWHLQWVSTL